jgi:Ca2+-binding EF-hand superfamily protein
LWDEKPTRESLIQAFKTLDSNGNGVLDVYEFRSFMLNYGEPLNSYEFDELMKIADLNHDGKISFSGKSYLLLS